MCVHDQLDLEGRDVLAAPTDGVLGAESPGGSAKLVEHPALMSADLWSHTVVTGPGSMHATG